MLRSVRFGKIFLIRSVLLRGAKESIAANKRILRNQDFRITNGNAFHRAIEVTQKPIGKTPRSTPATYLGVWDKIRAMISSLPSPRQKDYVRVIFLQRKRRKMRNLQRRRKNQNGDELSPQFIRPL